MKKMFWISLIVVSLVSMSTTAFAYSYGTSYLNIFNGTLIVTDVNSMALTEQNVTSTASASLNGTGTSSDGIGVGIQDPVAVNGTGSDILRTNNDFTLIGYGDSTKVYSGADAWVPSVQTVGPAPGFPILTTVQTIGIAEGLVSGGDRAASNTKNESSSLLSVDFSLGAPGQILFDFDAHLYMEAVLSAGELAPTSKSETKVSVLAEITPTGGGDAIFKWTPDGSLLTGITNGLELFDDWTLNTATDTQTPSTQNVFDPEGLGAGAVGTLLPAQWGNFSAITNPIPVGEYTLTLNAVTSQSVKSIQPTVIPEPSSYLLVGLGLVGLGYMARRKKS